MKRKPRPILKFRVFPSGGSLHFIVTVFDTKREMHAYCKGGHCSLGFVQGGFGRYLVSSSEATRGRRCWYEKKLKPLKRARRRGNPPFNSNASPCLYQTLT